MKISENGIVLTDEIEVNPVQQMGGDHMVVAAARVSTSGEDAIKFAEPDQAEGNAGLIRYLIQHRHGTPFEHSSLTFFVHAPIFVFREWHRHRVGFSYNEESARYKKLNPVFWVPRPERKIVPVPGFKPARPEFMAGTDEEHDRLITGLKGAYIIAYTAYEALLKMGYAREVSRAVLPVGIYSSCWVTCNPRSAMHFLSLRVHDPQAAHVSYPQAEIEQAAQAVETILKKGWPITHAAFVANGRQAP